MRRAIIFDDGRGQLAPLTDLRPAFAIRTGALTTLERLRRALDLQIAGVLVPPAIAEMTREQFPQIPVNQPEAEPLDLLLLNARCPLAYKEVASLQVGEAVVEGGSGDLIAMATTGGGVADLLAGRGIPSKRIELPAPALLSRAWHVRTFRDAAMNTDFALLCGAEAKDPAPALATAHVHVIPGFPVRVHPTARVYPGVVLDAETGPIVIDEGAVVRPASTIIGPAYVGPHATVMDRAIIKGFTAIGPSCKVGGEVGGTIFQGYTNKAHDGHLGDSWVGEWANFGAGTTNSNLLNTYAEVIVKSVPDGANERTGEKFLGCIVGDHVKFAICTRIMTGAVVHTGTMWAAAAPVAGCVGAFGWVTDAGAKGFRMEKFVEVVRAVMARRKMEPSGVYLARLAQLAVERGG